MITQSGYRSLENCGYNYDYRSLEFYGYDYPRPAPTPTHLFHTPVPVQSIRHYHYTLTSTCHQIHRNHVLLYHPPATASHQEEVRDPHSLQLQNYATDTINAYHNNCSTWVINKMEMCPAAAMPLPITMVIRKHHLWVSRPDFLHLLRL